MTRLSPADYLTLSRLLSVPVLWVLAAYGETVALGVLLVEGILYHRRKVG